MESIYLDSNIPSYITGRISTNIVVAGRQSITQEFWESRKDDFEFFISQYVLQECADGDVYAARRRMDWLLSGNFNIIPRSEEIEELGDMYVRLIGIPERSQVDSRHLAACVLMGIDFLLTWNCVHLGPVSFSKVKTYNMTRGLHTSVLITPDALLLDERNDLL